MEYRRIRPLLLAALAFAFSIAPAFADDRPSPLLPVDKSEGEDEAIEKRLEWFINARGLDENPDARMRRAQAVGHLKLQMANAVPALLASEAWEQRGPEGMTMLNWDMGNVIGRVTALAVDPANEDTIYLGAAAGGVWKTTTGGQSWTQLFDTIGTESIGSILMENGNPDHIWVGTGEAFAGCLDYFGLGLFYSSDGGATFEPRNGSGDTAMPLSFVTALAQSPGDPNVLIVGGQGHCNSNGGATGGGLYRTADGGATWTMVFAAGSGSRDVIFDPRDPNIVFAQLRSKGIYKSTDAGLTWNVLATGLPVNSAAAYGRLAMSPSNPDTMYALLGPSSGASLTLYRTDDAGATWATVNADACEGQCYYNLTLDVHPTDPETILVGTIRPALSTDGGTNLNILTSGWGQSQDVHQDTHIVRFSKNNGNTFWVGSDGGLWRSDDGGGSFFNCNSNLEITQFYDIALDPADPDRIYGGAQDNSSSVRADDELWNVTLVTGDGFMNAVDANDADRVFQTSYPSGGAALYLSASHGDPNTFQSVSHSGQNAADPFPWVTPLVTGGDYVFVGSNRVYRSQTGDVGNAYSWSDISGSITGSNAQSISILMTANDPIDGSLRMYAGTGNGKVWTSPDASIATPVFTDITQSYPGGNVSDIAADPTDVTRVFVTRSVFADPHLLRSVDGADWEGIGSGLPGVPANSVAIDPIDTNRIFVGTDIGVYESTDGGDTFAPFMAGMPLGMVVTDLEIVGEPHTLVAATYGRGAWRVLLQTPVTDRIFADDFDGTP
jgi:photosystem II stability/assembly factor-like uncharacterized protein